MTTEQKHKQAGSSFTNAGGFTLIEVIVALAVLTIGILSVNAMQTAAVRGNMAASDITISSTWASDRVERIFSLEYDDLTTGADGRRSVQDANNNGIDDDDETAAPAVDSIANFGLEQNTVAAADGNDVSPDGKYTILWNVAEDVPMPDTKTVYVIVTRNDRGTVRSVTLKHIKAKYF